MLHKNINIGDVHKIHNWVVANTTELNALVVTSQDIGKVAWQTDTDTFYVLTNNSPITWGSFGGSGTLPVIESIGDILFNDLSPIELGTATQDKRVIKGTVVVPEGWDGTGASVTVGTDSTNDLLVKADDIDITQVGTFEISPNYVFTANETVKVFISPGTLATTGKVFVSISLSN